MAETRVSRRIRAKRERVYRAFLDANDIQQWMVPTGMTSEVHTFDARVGGKLRVSLTYDEPTSTGKTTAQTDTYHGRFVELVPNERIVEKLEFETTTPGMQGEMTMIVELTSNDDGTTTVVATHEDLPPALSPKDNELGWTLSLEKLAALLDEKA